MKFKFVQVACAAAAGALLLSSCAGATEAEEVTGEGSAVNAVNKEAPLYSELPANVRDAGKIIVGSQLSSPPVIYLDTDAKTIKGLNYDMATALSKELGVPLEFQQISFASLTPSLQSGKIDAIFDMFSDTAERQETFDFVDYIHNGLTYLVPKGNPEGVSTSGDLCGKTLSGVRGTSLVAFLEEQAAKCQVEGKSELVIQQFGSASDARLQVQTGKSAAFLGQTLTMGYLADTAGEGKIFDAVTDDSYPLELIGMAFSKKDNDLRDALKSAFDNIMTNGTYGEILAKYDRADLAVEQPAVNGGK